MYHHNDIEMWSEHHHELLREAENGRLARKLRAERLKKAPRFGGGLLQSVRAHLSRRKGAAEC